MKKKVVPTVGFIEGFGHVLFCYYYFKRDFWAALVITWGESNYFDDKSEFERSAKKNGESNKLNGHSVIYCGRNKV
jgi:hypothetical protein